MDYFDKQDFKNKSHENCDQSMREPGPMSNSVFPDNWRVPQDGDFDFVSTVSFLPFFCLLSRFVFTTLEDIVHKYE